jgi:hypothetical protein
VRDALESALRIGSDVDANAAAAAAGGMARFDDWHAIFALSDVLEKHSSAMVRAQAAESVQYTLTDAEPPLIHKKGRQPDAQAFYALLRALADDAEFNDTLAAERQILGAMGFVAGQPTGGTAASTIESPTRTVADIARRTLAALTGRPASEFTADLATGDVDAFVRTCLQQHRERLRAAHPAPDATDPPPEADTSE